MSKRYRNYDHRRTCECCGNDFDASRYDAKYCSASCRSRFHRQSVKRSQQVERIKSAIDAAMQDTPLEYRDSLIADIMAHAAKWSVPVLG